MSTRVGKQTVVMSNPPVILGGAAIVGKKEGDGPLAKYFDDIIDDEYFGEKSFESAESRLLRDTLDKCLEKCSKSPSDLNFIISGDLQNQCTAANYAFRDIGVPSIGIYGACSTMAESLSLGAMLIDGGAADVTACITSSHFCSAERQYRYPLEFGSQRTPTAQWTVTGAGSIILGKQGSGPVITHLTPGKIVDMGIKDVNNMGGAMAPAAYDTVIAHLEDTGRGIDYYDLVLTGDLGAFGKSMMERLLGDKGIEAGERYNDCGIMIFDVNNQEVDCGGSGCGCSAAVVSTYVLELLDKRQVNKVLFVATGALMNPTRLQQGDDIPCIAHAVAIENPK
jgi:stage V sporulation protein AD